MSSQYIVSARKYRPSSFDTVVGQEAITATLQNAITNDHLAQAYLFCGPRGVGKTTCARIFAKQINVDEANGQELDDLSFNVFELDAASNNSVDDIRNLTDQVRIPPQVGKYKVYIIDEVHMLSQAAFNAFLKTLEEPPPHAIFVLATTEKHKIIPTILSRCQIFDFSRIQVSDIVIQLKEIGEKEGVSFENDALHIIAQKADGAMRDALSIFDQIVSFSGGDVTYQKTIENLNVLDYDYYFKLSECILNEDIAQVLVILDEVLQKGFDGHNFIVGLGEHFRNLLVCKDSITTELLDVGEGVREKYKLQAAKFENWFIIQALKLISNCDINYKSNKNQRLLVELTLMQICSINEEAKKKSSNVIEIIPPKKGLESVSSKSPSSSTPKPPDPVQPGVSKPAPAPVEVTLPKQEKEQPKPKPAIKANLGQINTGSISIMGSLNAQSKTSNEEEEEEDLSGKPKDEYSVDQFLAIWKQYAEQLKGEGRESLYSTLTRRKPTLKEGFRVEMIIDNKVQEQVLEKEKVEMMTFIREQLNNYAIQLEIVLQKNDDDSAFLYTSKEKFKKMAEKNPAIIKLRDKLNLDLDL